MLLILLLKSLRTHSQLKVVLKFDWSWAYLIGSWFWYTVHCTIILYVSIVNRLFSCLFILSHCTVKQISKSYMSLIYRKLKHYNSKKIMMSLCRSRCTTAVPVQGGGPVSNTVKLLDVISKCIVGNYLNIHLWFPTFPRMTQKHSTQEISSVTLAQTMANHFQVWIFSNRIPVLCQWSNVTVHNCVLTA